MLAELAYGSIVAALTVLSGLALTPKKTRLTTKLVYSFAIGFSLISLTGLVANALGTNMFAAQSTLVAALAAYSLFTLKRHEIKHDKLDKYALVVTVFYILLCLFLLRNTIAWMGGDQVGHAATIRKFLDGEKVSVGIYPFGSSSDHYPKAFYVFTFFWIKLLPEFGLLAALTVIPITVSAFSALALYTLLRELDVKETAFYALMVFSLLSVHHYGYLIWAGYPSQSAEMLMLVFLLAAFSNKKLTPLILIAVAFTHTRFLVYAAGVLFVWLWLEAVIRKRRWLPYLFAATAIVVAAALRLDLLSTQLNSPVKLLSSLSNPQYLLMWAAYILAVPAVFISLKQRSKAATLAFALVLSAFIISLSADAHVLKLPINVDRALNQAYIGLSILSAITLSWIGGKIKLNQVFTVFSIILLLAGIISMTLVFSRYTGVWSLSPVDYDTINWIGNQDYDRDDTLVVNMDSVGRWIHPITGLTVTFPKESSGRIDGYWIPYYSKENPTHADSLKKLNQFSKEYSNILFYSSSINRLQPDFEPPFRRHNEFYDGNINLTEFLESGYYRLLYSEGGVYILEFVPSNASVS